MVLYFSGTGNSKYAASLIAEALGEESVDIGERLKKKNNAPIASCEHLVFVVPTYAWKIPRPVEQWILETEFAVGQKSWFVMTCGGDVGGSEKYIRLLCEKKKLEFMGLCPVSMPDNYVALYDVTSDEEAKEKVAAAVPVIKGAAKKVALGEQFEKCKSTAYGNLMSGVVNTVFYSAFVKTKKFKVTSKCTGCRKCVSLCPLGNIGLDGEKPLWGNDCTHCMACISYCPTQAIEYGKRTVGKKRYTFKFD